MTNRTFILALAAGFLAVWPLTGSDLSAQTGSVNCTEAMEVDCIDWDAGIAIAQGTGSSASWATSPAQKNISAQRAAKVDAARNLLELIKGVAISSETTVQDAMVANDRVTTSIQGRVAGLRTVGDPRYFSDGTIAVRVVAQLRDVIPPETYLNGPPRELGPPRQVGLSSGGAIDTVLSYTGLILDARGTGALPAMAPKVLDTDGREVYGSAFVSREHAVAQGIVGYAKEVTAAQDNDRVKGNPLVIKAIEAKGQNKADLVISMADADALREIAQNQNFLRQTRVMVVLD